MPEPDEQTVKWQARLDRDFPRGAIAAWSGLTPPPASYQIPRILVLRVVNDHPVVLLPVLTGSDKVLGPWQVSAYEVNHGVVTGPLAGTQRVVRVTFEEDSRTMTWNPRVTDRLARVMAPERAAFMKLAPHGGRAAQHNPEEA